MVTVGLLPHFTIVVPGKRVPTSVHHVPVQYNAPSSLTVQKCPSYLDILKPSSSSDGSLFLKTAVSPDRLCFLAPLCLPHTFLHMLLQGWATDSACCSSHKFIFQVIHWSFPFSQHMRRNSEGCRWCCDTSGPTGWLSQRQYLSQQEPPEMQQAGYLKQHGCFSKFCILGSRLAC